MSWPGLFREFFQFIADTMYNLTKVSAIFHSFTFSSAVHGLVKLHTQTFVNEERPLNENNGFLGIYAIYPNLDCIKSIVSLYVSKN